MAKEVKEMKSKEQQLLTVFVYSFLLYQLLLLCAVTQRVCAVDESKQTQQLGTTNTNTNSHRADNDRSDRSPRYWPRYSGTRRVRILDGIWNTSRLGTCNGFESESVNCDHDASRGTSVTDEGDTNTNTNTNTNTRFDSMDPNIDISEIRTTERVTIPSTIEVVADPDHGYLPGYMGYRGVSFFRTHFETAPTERGDRFTVGPAARIQFQACSFYCRVWLNGIELGDHIAGGYVAWWLDVSEDVLELGRRHQPQQQQQQRRQRSRTTKENAVSDVDTLLTHELFVLVDNRFNSTTAPLHTGGDFWHYGGIMRSVEWHDRPNAYMSLNMVKPGMKPSAGRKARQSSVAETVFLEEEFETDVLSTVTKTEESSTVTNFAVDAKHFSPGDLHNTVVWPWRLYVIPQKDLRSVNLSLQLVSGNEDKTSRTNIEVLDELRVKNQIKIYFDENATANALDNRFVAAKEGIIESHIELETPSRAIKRPTATARGSDRLLELGRFHVPNPRIWSTQDPQLHTVSVNINGAIVTERFGLRYWDTVSASDGMARARANENNATKTPRATNNTSVSSRIRLNGRVLKLVGWNHHTQWPYTAASPTDEQLDEDIRLLKETGHANFVRGAHYPQDPRWLDRLDEHGIVVWCGKLPKLLHRGQRLTWMGYRGPFNGCCASGRRSISNADCV